MKAGVVNAYSSFWQPFSGLRKGKFPEVFNFYPDFNFKKKFLPNSAQ